jgi:bisphosphoglycerate-independent phosphoglycerate mutase (AlkP superfamily)
MDLSEANRLLREIKSVIPTDMQLDGSILRIVASDVFGNTGSYSLAIKRTEVNGKVLGKISDIVDKHGLSISL